MQSERRFEIPIGQDLNQEIGSGTFGGCGRLRWRRRNRQRFRCSHNIFQSENTAVLVAMTCCIIRVVGGK